MNCECKVVVQVGFWHVFVVCDIYLLEKGLTTKCSEKPSRNLKGATLNKEGIGRGQGVRALSETLWWIFLLTTFKTRHGFLFT